MESIFDQLRQFSFPSMMLRVLLAMLMGGIVGFVVIAIILPIFEMSTLAG